MNINIIASGSAGNATMISDGKTSLLLDAGINIKRILSGSGFTLSNAAGCLTTHEHSDHANAVKPVANLGVDIYASRGTLDALNVSGHRYKELKLLETFSIGTFDVMAFDVVHDAADPVGYFIGSKVTGDKLVYFVDTAFVKYKFTDITHIIAECNHGDRELRQSVQSEIITADLAKRITKNHMSLERFIDFLYANDLSRLKVVHLVHLSDTNSNAERFKREVRRITGVEVYIH